jgi:apolipoprotein N-acyltransferase
VEPSANANAPVLAGDPEPAEPPPPSSAGPAPLPTVLPLRLALAAAAGGGLLIYVSLIGPGWWPFALFGAALVTLAARGRSLRGGAAVGALAGLATFVPLLFWLHVVGYDAWLGLAVLEAVLVIPLGMALALLTRLPGWPVWVATAWVADEALRDRIPFGGFPWGRLAYTQAASWLTPFAALGGAPLLTAVVGLIGALLLAAGLAFAAGRARRQHGTFSLVGVVVLLAIGLVIPVPTQGQTAGGPASAVVAAVQGNVPHPGLHFLGRPEQVLNHHVAETDRLAADVAAGRVARPDVVIWPENASDLDPFTDRAAYDVINAAVTRIDLPTLVGAVVEDKTDPTHLVDNEGIVWNPGLGPGATYVKQHPVPFGEYVPFRSVLTKLIGRFSLVPQDFAHGHRNGILQLGPVRIGDIICFEVAYDGIVRHTVTGGGRVIVVQTNNATYAHTAESGQQLAIARLRAVEHGRTVVIAATSGISAIIRPDGSVVAQTKELVPATLVDRVPLRDSTTLADRLGPWPEIVLCIVCGASIVVAYMRRRSDAAA